MPGKSGRRIDIQGQTFGKWKVLERAGCVLKPGRKHKRSFWLCECRCGRQDLVDSHSLRSGKNKQCSSCAAIGRGWVGSQHPGFRGYEEISGLVWTHIKTNARKRNLPISVSIEDIWQLYLKQNRRCKLSGVPILFGNESTQSAQETTASLDRIDSSVGYHINNVQWVHKTVNIMKQSLSDEEFVKWCTLITHHNCYNNEQ